MTKRPNYVFDDELYHHGIIGQRWGHRRYQNEDGSWTQEGRERYGEGGARSKADVQKYKAKVSYQTQKYKADLKSKAKREADSRAAKEERHRLKEWRKTEKKAQKEQAKVDGNKAVVAKTTKNMSDEDLQKAIARLKLEAEYNKQYAVASKPNSALARADQFFEGATGKAVLELSKAVLPNVAQAVAQKVTESKMKYDNKLDRDKAQATIDASRAKAEADRAKAAGDLATAESTRQSMRNAKAESDNKIYLERIKTNNESWSKVQAENRANAESNSKIGIAERAAAATVKNQALKNMAEVRAKNVDTNYKAITNKILKDTAYGGVVYENPQGTKYVTAGTIANQDERDKLSTIEKRKRMGLNW